MASLCDPELSRGRGMIEQVLPTYNLSSKDLLACLRNVFGEDGFHIDQTNDQYVMTLPRRLTELEVSVLTHLRIGQHLTRRNSISRQADHLEKSTEQTPFAKVSPTKRSAEKGLNEESRPTPTPFDKASGLYSSPIPSKEGDLGEIRSISNFHSHSQESTSSLYSILVSNGFTSSVFAVDARWDRVWAGATLDKNFQGKKVAVKRLIQGTTPQEFLQEYQALKAATRSHHRNIVDLLQAFRYEDEDKSASYNFSFPLAVCSLDELFYAKKRDSKRIPRPAGQRQTQRQIKGSFYYMAREKLWSEFEGLANGLAYLHEVCQIVHSDIKSSNIVLYESSGMERIVVAKLTDFGMAVDLKTKLSWRLGSKEARSAWQYDAPEIRNSVNDTIRLGPSPIELKGGDVWKLGSVFVELFTFLVKGQGGVPQFREFITTTYRELTSDGISDTRFDDGKQVKAEVLEWISRLASIDPRVRELEALLQSMLSLPSNRPTALSVSNALKKSSICLHFDGMRYLNFTPSPFVRPLHLIDRCREQLEELIGHRVDWRPFKNPDRTCPPRHTRISWLMRRERLYIDVPDLVAHSYKDTCRPLSSFSQPASQPSDLPDSSPTYHSLAGTYSQPGVDLGTLGKEPILNIIPSKPHNEERISNESVDHPRNGSIQQTQAIWREIYWCVDQVWSGPRVTRLCNLRERPRIFDDDSLCQHLMQEYNRIRTWKDRYLSWKTCLGVEFIRFSRTNQENHVVKVQNGLPPSDSKFYEYVPKQPEQVHMMIAAEQLGHSLRNPEKGVSVDDRTLRMIPKRLVFTAPNTPHNDFSRLANNDEDDHWGIYARARFSLRKILAWVTGLTVLGLVFVILWLVLVDKQDLQNAVKSYAVCAMGMMMGLGIPQFLEVD